MHKMLTTLIIRGQSFFPSTTFSSINSVRGRIQAQAGALLKKIVPELMRTFPNYEPVKFNFDQPDALALFNVIKYELGLLGCSVEKLNDSALQIKQNKPFKIAPSLLYRQALYPLQKKVYDYLIEEEKKRQDLYEKSSHQYLQFLISVLNQNPWKTSWEVIPENEGKVWHHKANDILATYGIQVNNQRNKIRMSLSTIIPPEKLESCDVLELKLFWSAVHQEIQRKAQEIADSVINDMLTSPSKSDFSYNVRYFLSDREPEQEWDQHFGYLCALTEAVGAIFKTHEDIQDVSIKTRDEYDTQTCCFTIKLKMTEYQNKAAEDDVGKNFRF